MRLLMPMTVGFSQSRGPVGIAPAPRCMGAQGRGVESYTVSYSCQLMPSQLTTLGANSHQLLHDRGCSTHSQGKYACRPMDSREWAAVPHFASSHSRLNLYRVHLLGGATLAANSNLPIVRVMHMCMHVNMLGQHTVRPSPAPPAPAQGTACLAVACKMKMTSQRLVTWTTPRE